jgi:integrase
MLTVLECKNAKPAEKPYRLSDGLGMYLEVTPTGAKYWRLKYRFAGKEKRLALGVFPEVSPAEARAERDKARKLLAEDIDPGELRKINKIMRLDRSENSFEAVAREWFAKFSPNWAKGHAEKIIQRLERDVFPWLGGRPIGEIKAPELLAVLRRIENRGVLETAHRAKQNCGQIFRYAVATGRAERDPSQDLKGALPPVKQTHFASITEPSEVAKLLRAMDGYNGGIVVRAALRLAPLVFVRPGELRQARWQDIDLEAAEWRYLVSKTQTQHIVPLSSQTLEILRELQPVTGHKTYVFAGERGEGRPMSNNTVNAALRYLGFDGETMTGHGFRAMARTILDEVLGFPPYIIEHQLAHAVRDPLGRAYNRTSHLPERRRMMQTWADYLDKLKTGAEIIPLHAAA